MPCTWRWSLELNPLAWEGGETEGWPAQSSALTCSNATPPPSTRSGPTRLPRRRRPDDHHHGAVRLSCRRNSGAVAAATGAVAKALNRTETHHSDRLSTGGAPTCVDTPDWPGTASIGVAQHAVHSFTPPRAPNLRAKPSLPVDGAARLAVEGTWMPPAPKTSPDLSPRRLAQSEGPDRWRSSCPISIPV
jgi:hypothetical protein